MLNQKRAVTVVFISIDRFEGDFAVCEDDNLKIINIPRSKLPKEAKEGDVLKCFEGNYAVDYEETKRRKLRAFELQKIIFDNDGLK